MYLYRFTYSDGLSVLRTFTSEKEASWFAYNEGDHLLKVEKIWLRVRGEAVLGSLISSRPLVRIQYPLPTIEIGQGPSDPHKVT